MNLTKIAGVLLAVLLVASAGAAAMPGNAPADSQAGQADNYSDDADDPARADDGGSEMAPDNPGREMASEMGAADSDDDKRGPPVDMPAQVPNFVSQIHELVHQHLDGDIADLGAQIADVTPDDADSEESEDADSEDSEETDDAEDADSEDADSEDADADATATATPSA